MTNEQGWSVYKDTVLKLAAERDYGPRQGLKNNAISRSIRRSARFEPLPGGERVSHDMKKVETVIVAMNETAMIESKALDIMAGEGWFFFGTGEKKVLFGREGKFVFDIWRQIVDRARRVLWLRDFYKRLETMRAYNPYYDVAVSDQRWNITFTHLVLHQLEREFARYANMTRAPDPRQEDPMRRLADRFMKQCGDDEIEEALVEAHLLTLPSDTSVVRSLRMRSVEKAPNSFFNSLLFRWNGIYVFRGDMVVASAEANEEATKYLGFIIDEWKEGRCPNIQTTDTTSTSPS